ncbi:MAG: hypothetical protein Q9M39_02255 [Sulfurovum sp.]|nr:hypothetical protein [Sulfurovum sp.]
MNNEILNQNYYDLLNNFNYAKGNEYENYIFRLESIVKFKHNDIVIKRKKLQEELEEKVLWKDTISINTKEAYENFINRYCSGIFYHEAIQKIDEFVAIERNKKLEKEKLDKIQANREKDRLLEEEYNILMKYSNISINNEFLLRKANNVNELKNTTHIQYKGSHSIPSSIGNFDKLKVLSIKYPFESNVRVEVPLSIGKLIHLEELAISSCTSSVGLSIILPNFKKLKHLF